jgi:hypothetical protein
MDGLCSFAYFLHKGYGASVLRHAISTSFSDYFSEVGGSAIQRLGGSAAVSRYDTCRVQGLAPDHF